MAASVRAIDYVYVTVKERPGEAYQLLSELAEAGVNLLAFSAIPSGPGHTQLVLVPNKMERLVQVAEQLGLVLTGPQRAFLVQGDDRLGTIAEIQRKLLDRNIHAYASSGVTDGRVGFWYVLYINPEDFEGASHALGVEQTR